MKDSKIHHPHQENKSGSPSYASFTHINSSTNNPLTEDEQKPSANDPEIKRTKRKRIHRTVSTKVELE